MLSSNKLNQTNLISHTRGPSSLTLTNDDKEVAIATGSITAGDYEFQLTVTDSSGQQSSEKLTVTVKKGLWSIDAFSVMSVIILVVYKTFNHLIPKYSRTFSKGSWE